MAFDQRRIVGGQCVCRACWVSLRLYADNGNVDLGLKAVDEKGVETFVGSAVEELTGISGKNVRVGDVVASRFCVEASNALQANNIGAKYEYRPQLVTARSAVVQNISPYVDLRVQGDLVCQSIDTPEPCRWRQDLFGRSAPPGQVAREIYVRKSARLDFRRYASIFVAFSAFSTMKSRRGSTTSPISVENTCSATSA